MKHVFFLLVTVIASLLVLSCSTSVPEKITRIADKVEKKGDRYSLEDWGKVAEQLEPLLLDFADNYNNYKISEKADVVKAVARITAKAAQCGAGEVLEGLDLEDGIFQNANSLIEGAKGFLEGLGL